MLLIKIPSAVLVEKIPVINNCDIVGFSGLWTRSLLKGLYADCVHNDVW